MKNATILIVIGKDADLAAQEARLEALGALRTRAIVLIAAEIPLFPYYAISAPPYGMTAIPAQWQEDVNTLQANLKTMAAKLEAVMQKHGVTGEVAVVSTEPSLIAEGIVQRAMLCDVVVIDDGLRAEDPLFFQTVHGVLFQSPVGVILNDRGASALGASQTVLIGWTSHLHTARAVHQALPLLKTAAEVIVVTVDPVASTGQGGEDPGIDVAEWLTHHGCKVSVQQVPSGGQDIGACLLARARDCGAGLIVMGSYGHSRLRQAMFGGTTRSMIDQTMQAVFLGH